MNAVYVGRSRVLTRTCYGAPLVVPGHDLSVSPELILSGTHELPLTRYLAANVRTGWNVVDVGAHIGYFTVLLGSSVGPHGRVVAYEANPEAYAYLLDNLSMNYMRERVSTHCKAILDREGEVAFFACRRFLGNSSLHAHDVLYHRNYSDEVEELRVPAEPLSLAVASLDRVHLMKIDIEGGEYRAFEGMRDALITNRVHDVVFEINPAMLQADYEPLCDLLRDYERRGRRFFTLGDGGESVAAPLPALIEQGASAFVLMR